VLGFCLKVRGWSTRCSTTFSTSRFVCRSLSSSFWGILRYLVGIGKRETIMMLCVEGIWWIFENSLAIVIYTGHSFLLPAKFNRCVPLHMKIKGTSGSPTLSVDLMSISKWLSTSISAYLWLPTIVHGVDFGTKAFWWRITINAMQRGVNVMLSVGWLPHQPSHAFDDISTPVFNRPLVVVIPSHILESV